MIDLMEPRSTYECHHMTLTKLVSVLHQICDCVVNLDLLGVP